MGVKCLQSQSLRIPPTLPLCTGTRTPEQNGQGLRKHYTVFRHTQRLPHTWILREAHREKERDQEARYRHKETERQALTQEEARTQSDLHTPTETERLLQKERQREMSKDSTTQRQNRQKE